MPLVSRVSGVADMVEDGHSGLLFAPGDLSAFAERLAKTVALPPEPRRSMGAAGRETVRARFAIDEVAERHIEVYRSLCHETQRRN